MAAAAGLHAGFGAFLGAETLAEIRAHGFTIVRIDCQDVDQALTAQLAQEVIDAGLQPLVIIRRVEQLSVLPVGALAEAGNEPDIAKFGWTKRRYRDFAIAAAREALARQIRLYVGVVSNLNDRGFEWLEELPWETWPAEICGSVHRYPEGSDPRTPHKGCKSREHEIAKLRAIVGQRPLAITETGYHDAVISEADVAAHMVYERQLFDRAGFDFVVAYQLNDGPPDSKDGLEAHFGARRFGSHEWKPWAEAFTHAI